MNDNENDSATEAQLPETAESGGVAAEAATTPDPAGLQRQRDEYYDLLLRKTAEFENFRKRTERERQTVSEAISADVLKDLLPLVDDLERALKAATGSDSVDAYRRGVELIHQHLMDLLRKRGVRPIEALGADFDPHYHQAVSHEQHEGARDGEVLEEFGRGYMLGDRLLRPSMVKVAKG